MSRTHTVILAVMLTALAASPSLARPAVSRAVISSGGVITANGSIIILGQPIAGLACAPTGSPPPCVHAGFVPTVAPPACPGDADASGAVTFLDITTVLANFGNVYGTPPTTGPGDADRTGSVNFLDITTVLANFGTNCP